MFIVVYKDTIRYIDPDHDDENLVPEWLKETYKKDIQRADVGDTMVKLVKLVMSHPSYPLTN